MLTVILHRNPVQAFYRLEITDNLFGEYTVAREWGRRGRRLGTRLSCFGNLRDAVQAADRWHGRALARGYRLTERTPMRGST